jgi:serine acetyltransferase
MNNKHYLFLLIMALLHFAAMYVLMYAMVNIFDNVYSNFNQFYMAGLMTTPMIIIELLLMKAMYHNKKWNILIVTVSSIMLVTFFMFIRQQAGIGDKQFLKSMIPHHAGAILMCEQASIQDPEIRELCRQILISQQSEIDLMKRKLNELEK